MAETIVDKYVIDTKEAVNNLNQVNKELTDISQQSKKTASQVNNDFLSAARGGQALTKQYNGLNIAVSQFARELPNAAISAQTFFTSISNQFGQLQDAITRINAQNKELAAQGLKTQSAFKQVAGAIFSLNTLINLGVLALVLYGKELGNLISSLFKGAGAFDEAKKRFELLNQAFESKSVLKAVTEVDELRRNIELAKDGFISKKDVIDQYNKSVGNTAGQVSTLDEAEQSLVKNGQAYIRLTLLKAAANLANEEAAKAQVDALKETLAEEERIRKEAATRITFNNDPEGAGLDQFLANARQQSITKRRNDAKKRIEDLEKIATEFQNQAAKFAEENDFDFFGDAKDDTADQNRRLRELRERLQREQKMLQDIADQQIPGGGLNVRLREDEQFEERTKRRFKLLEERIDTEKKLEIKKEKELQELQEEAFKEAEDFAKREAALNDRNNKERIREEKRVQSELLSLNEQLFNNIFQLRSANAQAAADEEIRRLEEGRDTQLENDKLTAEQREQIEEDFNTKRAAILNKNAQVQRQLDLSAILVNTALAVIRALATAPNPAAGAVLAALAAAEGAIQYGFASAQPLPKFALGTDRVKGGRKGIDSVHALLMPDEAVIKADENMKYPGLAAAWNKGRLEPFLTMKYLEPALEEMHRKEAAKINNTFVNNNKVSGISDKRIVKSLQENTHVNRLILNKITNESNHIPTKHRRFLS